MNGMKLQMFICKFLWPVTAVSAP